jgi:hypothetical protein
MKRGIPKGLFFVNFSLKNATSNTNATINQAM